MSLCITSQWMRALFLSRQYEFSFFLSLQNHCVLWRALVNQMITMWKGKQKEEEGGKEIYLLCSQCFPLVRYLGCACELVSCIPETGVQGSRQCLCKLRKSWWTDDLSQMDIHAGSSSLRTVLDRSARSCCWTSQHPISPATWKQTLCCLKKKVLHLLPSFIFSFSFFFPSFLSFLTGLLLTLDCIWLWSPCLSFLFFTLWLPPSCSLCLLPSSFLGTDFCQRGQVACESGKGSSAEHKLLDIW